MTVILGLLLVLNLIAGDWVQAGIAAILGLAFVALHRRRPRGTSQEPVQ